MRYMQRPRILLPLVLIILAVLALPAMAKDFEKSFTFDADELVIANMIGKVDVRQASGDQFKITVTVRGDDAEQDMIKFETREGSQAELQILFPVDDHRKYVYPELGRGSKTTINYHGDDGGGSWLKKIFGNDRITVRGKGSGLEVWADVLVEVPRSGKLEARQGVGSIEAEEVAAELVLDTHSGSISAIRIEGDLSADTGSGRVTVADVMGNVHVDTGSGKVEIDNCEGESIYVDTGSGSVKSTSLICQNLKIDTGSGSVRARNVSADDVNIDTGSGSVALQLDRMGTGDFVLDTGSGSIVLEVPDGASARISADTGSGSMHNELQGAIVKNMGRREMTLEVGDAEAHVRLDAGSGSITVK